MWTKSRSVVSKRVNWNFHQDLTYPEGHAQCLNSIGNYYIQVLSNFHLIEFSLTRIQITVTHNYFFN